MKRWGSNLVIALYLSAMCVGIVSQTLKFGNSSHPAMYYLIWDMFCGWSAHEIRYHVVGQGESGTYYELAPSPWTRFMPYGDLDRLHYDVLGNAHHKMALNALKRTDHEPINRIVILEEVWQKKYNLSDRIWALRFDEPKDKMSYFWQRTELDGEGRIMSAVPDYLAYLHNSSIAANPRLIADMHVGKEHYIYDPAHRVHSPE